MSQRVALVTASPAAYGSVRLREALTRLGHLPEMVDPARVVVRVGETSGVFEDGRELPPPDVIVPRVTGPLSPWACAVVGAWVARGVPCPNPPEAIARAHDKLATALALAAARVPAVQTLAVREPRHADAAIPSLVPSPEGAWVVKLPAGAAGLGVARAEGDAAARALAELAASGAGVALVQPWIRTEPVSDLRVLVAGFEPLAAMRRRAPEGEFRANVHRGARGVAEPHLGAALGALAVEAARAVGLPFCGVDLLEAGDGATVLEVNATPGFEGMERAWGADLATPFMARWMGWCTRVSGPVGLP
jgi:ribosomal protein S6--L-glutamate ligase